MNKNVHFFDFSLTDLIWDEDFRKWALLPDPQSDNYWSEFSKANPDKVGLLNNAKKIVQALNIREPFLSELEKALEVRKILTKIDKKEWMPSKPNGIIRLIQLYSWQLGLTACIMIVIAFSIFRINQQPVKQPVTYQEQRAAETKLHEKINPSANPDTVLLPDGTKVVLMKNARISYSPDFSLLTTRKIFLSGTAIFEVARNPQKPFLVYTNGLITEVLGTRFIIKSMDAGNKVSVEVISGIVSVYSFINNKPGKEKESKKLNALILTANQKANYSSEDKTLMAAIVTNPAVLLNGGIDFKFKGTPVDSVFKAIEKAYGINIIYDEGSFKNRSFTATLNLESMYDKLDIICKALNSRYDVIDGKIVIYNNAPGY